jgi:LDH2 family malate/lactate/ureidoglycolate dehydrogenase
VLYREPKGTILPVGGLDAGHTGYALAMIVELLTGGLAGLGRADATEGWGATVTVQVWDPEAFGGTVLLARQADWLVQACRSNPPRPGVDAVRVPGQRGLARRREQLKRGVELQEDIVPGLAPWTEKLGVPWPAALGAVETEARPAKPV